MKKLGLISLALVLALGALGVGYAAWTDTITIEGTVNTGSVDINVEYFSGTDVYKDLDTDEMVWVFWVKDREGGVVNQEGKAPDNGLLVAWAAAAPGQEDDTVIVTFNNAFPCGGRNPLFADFIVHYEGSVPAKVFAEIESDDEWLVELWDTGYAGAMGSIIEPSADGFDFVETIEELPIQMHYCDYAWVGLWLDIPQEDRFMGLSGSFTAKITAIQWNKYEEYYGEPN